MIKIGPSVFSNCKKLSTLKIPKTVNQIDNAFQRCDNLENIDLTGNLSYLYENGMLMTKDKTNILFVSEKYLQGTDTFEIPGGVINLNINISTNTSIKK